MSASEAKRVALRLVACDLDAVIGLDSWREQGLLDEYREADQTRIMAAAVDLVAEFFRRAK